MKVEIVQKTENPMFKRTEVKFKVEHAGGPTPKRLDVRGQLAALLGVPEELVVIDKLASAYGKQEASGIARAYGSRERLEALEPKYLLKRGLPKEKKEEAKAEEKPKEKPKEKAEEKPKEEKAEAKEKAEKPKEEKPKEETPAKAEKPEKPNEEAKAEKREEAKREKKAETGGS